MTESDGQGDSPEERSGSPRSERTTSAMPIVLSAAPRVAAIALIIQALVQPWAASATGLSMSLRAAIFFATAALCVAQLASLSVIALHTRSRWAIAGLLAWTIGWVASIADLGALILWSLGGPFPLGPHQLRLLDPDVVQLLARAGGLVIGYALLASIPDVRVRHSAVALLVGYAVFGVIAAVTDHRIELAMDFPTTVELRRNRDLAHTMTAFALAGVLWLYWRRVVSHLPRATQRG